MTTGSSGEPQRKDVDEIARVLRQRGAPLPDGRTHEEAALEWLASGFDDPEEVGEWLDARCLTAGDAELLERAGLTPEQAALRTGAGAGGYEDTIGFKLSRGDLSLDEARRIITSEFWNS
jgi:hypothetical protein